MGQDTTEIVVGANGSIQVAPVATAAPVNPTAAYVGWSELGLASDAGVKVRDAKTLEEIPAWQLFYAARIITTAREFLLSFALMQWNRDNIELAFGGGTFSEPAAGVYKYVPPAPQDTDEREFGLDWQDGSKNYRLLIPKGQAVEPVESDFQRKGAALLPITFKVIGAATGDPWYFLTDDPAFAP